MSECNKPQELVQIYIDAAEKKAKMPFDRLLVLSILAGAYIAFGAEFFTVASTQTVEMLGFGVAKVLGGAAFSVGLMLVVVCGGELFTGNCLIVTGLPYKRVRIDGLIYNWIVVYFGNMLGALVFVMLIIFGGTWAMAGGASGQTAVNIGLAKCQLGWVEALCRGICCNWLVCLGVWMGLAARDIAGKVWGIFFPIAAFVAMGFEHCVANMYFIPKALLLKHAPELARYTAANEGYLADLNLHNFILANLIPVTFGNIIGGAVFVGMLYSVAYRKP